MGKGLCNSKIVRYNVEKTEKVVDEMNSYEKLKRVCDEVDPLLAKCVTAESPEFKAWQLKAENILTKCYGVQSREFHRFRNIIFYPRYAHATQSDEVDQCVKGLKEAKAYFEVYLEEIENDCAENVLSDVSGMSKNISDEVKSAMKNVNSARKKKVFIVHGHDNALKQEVARMVEKQGLEAIILSEQANGGKTIIEKIEENAEVGAAICLFTKDDYGRAKDASEDKLRARQNVVFEAGYFMGKLGRGNVIIVADKDLELPSDMQGVVYTDSKNWKIEVLQGLDKIGYAIDFNKLFRR